MRRMRVALWGLVLCVWMLACSEAPTQIVVVIDPDANIAMRLTTVQVTMRRIGSEQTINADASYPFSQDILRANPRDGHLILRPRDPADARLVVITVRGELRDHANVTYEVATRFERAHTLYLNVPLVAACARVTNCPEGTTCREGTCVAVPEQRLVETPPPVRDASVDAGDIGADALADATPRAAASNLT